MKVEIREALGISKEAWTRILRIRQYFPQKFERQRMDRKLYADVFTEMSIYDFDFTLNDFETRRVRLPEQ